MVLEKRGDLPILVNVRDLLKEIEERHLIKFKSTMSTQEVQVSDHNSGRFPGNNVCIHITMSEYRL